MVIRVISIYLFLPFYLEHLVLLIKREGWQVTKIYSHYTFEQERFKRDFILINQRSRQNAKDSVKKDFFKLLNNARFEYHCRNKLDNCTFEPICDETEEIAYIKKYSNIFHKSILAFVNSKVVGVEIANDLKKKMLKISKNNRFRDTKINSLEAKRSKDLGAVERPKT